MLSCKEEQHELQKNYYTDYIQAQPGWVFVGIYADEGISGTSLEHRKGMQQLIEDCKAGKIDLVLTKSIARFARNIVDCLSVIELLKNLNPPVGVKFEADNIYTLDSNGRMILTILASVAEEESHSKSIIMNWSIDRRFSRGLFLTPALLGFSLLYMLGTGTFSSLSIKQYNNRSFTNLQRHNETCRTP